MDYLRLLQVDERRGIQLEAAGLGVLISTSNGSIATKFIVANQKLSM